jgi:hypothetical protein
MTSRGAAAQRLRVPLFRRATSREFDRDAACTSAQFAGEP